MRKRLSKTLKDFYLAGEQNLGLCNFCENHVECKGKECESYESGDRAVDTRTGEELYWHWDCTDYEYGTCPMMEHTPCNGCIKNGYANFSFAFKSKVCFKARLENGNVYTQTCEIDRMNTEEINKMAEQFWEEVAKTFKCENELAELSWSYED